MSASQPRVPAWKRLGLRLKYAKETADDQTTANESHNAAAEPSEKPSHESELTESTRPAKKRKVSPSQDRHQGQNGRNEGVFEATSPLQGSLANAKVHKKIVLSSTETGEPADHEQVHHNADQQRAPRRKSVAFTSDTKEDDGFSARTLFTQSTTAGQPTTSSDLNADNTSSPTSNKAKRKLRSQAKKPIDTKSDVGPPEYVKYLDTYTNDKARWKFNKNNQTELLRNIFNLDQLPSRYTDAIRQYVEGLKGAAARTRLAESAQAVLQAIVETEEVEGESRSMESAEARRNAYAAALKSQLERYERANAGRSEYDEEQLEEMRQDAELGKRAENLFELLQHELRPHQHAVVSQTSSETAHSASTPTSHTNDTSQSFDTNSSTSQPPITSKRKSRKSRTQGASSDDSSSEDEKPAYDKPAYKKPTTGPTTVSEALRPSAIPEMSMRISQPLEKLASGKRVIFDDDMLDSMFPKKTYLDTGVKRKADKSESSSDSESDSDE